MHFKILNKLHLQYRYKNQGSKYLPKLSFKISTKLLSTRSSASTSATLTTSKVLSWHLGQVSEPESELLTRVANDMTWVEKKLKYILPKGKLAYSVGVGGQGHQGPGECSTQLKTKVWTSSPQSLPISPSSQCSDSSQNPSTSLRWLIWRATLWRGQISRLEKAELGLLGI